MTLPAPAQAATPARSGAADIRIHDDILPVAEQETLLKSLKGPGWAFGAYSDPGPAASRYWYKHFAGVVRDGSHDIDSGAFERELAEAAPLVSAVWLRLKGGALRGHALTRCYANGYPNGSEGGLHLDSSVATHFTAIYYPHLKWHPNFAGETVFFDRAGEEIIAAVYPKPNRLVVFPGDIPHVGRGVSRSCPELRITLMFKTLTA
ncbi:MAG: hypothetical protein JOZ27_08790 [Caulobacteraceae bacterium]|nr:hypothetical protein [Caulobacteraceae bacterium]